MSIRSSSAGDGEGRGLRSFWAAWIALGVTTLVGLAWLVASRLGGEDANTSASSRDPVSVLGTSVQVVDGAVVSACYTFDLPTLTEYEMYPESGTCNTAIRWVDGDSLTEITVLAQVGENDLDYFFDKIAEVSVDTTFTLPPSEVITVSGESTGLAYAVNSWGVVVALYFVPETTGAFEVDGEVITSFLISGPGYNAEFRGVLEELVESFTILD